MNRTDRLLAIVLELQAKGWLAPAAAVKFIFLSFPGIYDLFS